MENSFKTQELKQLLYKDLKIDMAFPFFPLGAKAGSAACCVVMTIKKTTATKKLISSQVDMDWIEKLTNNSTEIIELKSPRHSRITTEGGANQKQSPTVNVYVNLLLKSTANR